MSKKNPPARVLDDLRCQDKSQSSFRVGLYNYGLERAGNAALGLHWTAQDPNPMVLYKIYKVEEESDPLYLERKIIANDSHLEIDGLKRGHLLIHPDGPTSLVRERKTKSDM